MQLEPKKNLADVAPTDRIVHTDRVQTYEGDLAPSRPRKSLATWSWVDVGNNPNRPTVDEITRNQLQWNMFNNRPGQRHNDHNSRTLEDTESVETDPIYSGEDGTTPLQLGLEDVQ